MLTYILDVRWACSQIQWFFLEGFPYLGGSHIAVRSQLLFCATRKFFCATCQSFCDGRFFYLLFIRQHFGYFAPPATFCPMGTKFGSNQGYPKTGKRGTNESERILANLDKTEQTGQDRWNQAKPGKNRQYTGKSGQTFLGKKRAKNGQKTGINGQTNGQTKSNPGKTGWNQKFCRI